MSEPDRLASVRGLSFQYGDGTAALRGVDLDLGAGEVVGILGPNGCGKTTLLRLVARCSRVGWDTPPGASGAIEYTPTERPTLALDRPQFQPWLSGRENLNLFQGLRGQPLEAEAVRDMVEEFRLAEFIDRPVASYSRGMARRLQLAVTLSTGARVALIDEPLGGLDPESRETFARSLRVRASAGCGVLLSTHDPEFAEAACDRVGFMTEGALVAIDTPARLMEGFAGEGRIEVAFAVGTRPELEETELPPGISAADPTSEGLSLSAADPASSLPGALAWLIESGGDVRSVTVREPGLGDAYRGLTGSSLGATDEGE